jgi:hypothetical protein
LPKAGRMCNLTICSVPLEGGRPNRIAHAISQPPIQVLAELEIVRVENETPGRVSPCFGELLVDFLVLLAVDRLALRPLRRLDGVAGDVASVLALGDTVALGWHLPLP